VRELLDSYDFPGDDIPVITGLAPQAFEHFKAGGKVCAGENEWSDKILDLMDAVMPRSPDVRYDKALGLMAVEDVFSITVAAPWPPAGSSVQSRSARPSNRRHQGHPRKPPSPGVKNVP